MFHVIISQVLKPGNSNWAALLAWKKNPKRKWTGKGLWFSQNESPVIRASTVSDSINFVTLKSGSTLAFPFSFLCSPASSNWFAPPHPLTFYTKAFRPRKFLQAPLGRTLGNLPTHFHSLVFSGRCSMTKFPSVPFLFPSCISFQSLMIA